MEPEEEGFLRDSIPTLKPIENNISSMVQAQYEEHPYPKWINLALNPVPKSIAEVSNLLRLQITNRNIFAVKNPQILIAGCGTGQHPITTSTRFSDSKILAIDLSLTSIAYAQRKTRELKLNNICFMQADILELGALDQTFDIIESAGVLHHLDNPLAGWKTLVNLLRPNGLMMIGLYSETARQNITRVRKKYQVNTVSPAKQEIRVFRETIMESNQPDEKKLADSRDFYSLSTVRDLVFHVKEHQFTIPQIKRALEKLGLAFCGFEITNPSTKPAFNQSYSNPDDFYNLDNWNSFEASNPDTFSGMYTFWCQKVS